jgi:DnaJ-class molecular chaperone
MNPVEAELVLEMNKQRKLDREAKKMEKCPECDGGWLYFHFSSGDATTVKCDKCLGTGVVSTDKDLRT